MVSFTLANVSDDRFLACASQFINHSLVNMAFIAIQYELLTALLNKHQQNQESKGEYLLKCNYFALITPTCCRHKPITTAPRLSDLIGTCGKITENAGQCRNSSKNQSRGSSESIHAFFWFKYQTGRTAGARFLEARVLLALPTNAGDRNGTVVKVLCYNSEGR